MGKIKIKGSIILNIVAPILLMVLGVLIVLAYAIGRPAILSIPAGILVIVMGGLILFNYILDLHTMASIVGLVGSAIIALGISFIIDNFIFIVFALVPYIFFTVGIVSLGDAILAIVFRKERQLPTTRIIIEFAIAMVAIALGVLMLTIPVFESVMCYVLAGGLFILGIYLLVVGIIKKEKNSLESKLKTVAD